MQSHQQMDAPILVAPIIPQTISMSAISGKFSDEPGSDALFLISLIHSRRYPKDHRTIKLWMARMNLEHVKPMSALVCSRHFRERDMTVLPDGLKALHPKAFPKPYVHTMVNSDSDIDYSPYC